MNRRDFSMTHRRSRRSADRTLPYGWMAVKAPDSPQWRIGPRWYLLPETQFYRLQRWFYYTMLYHLKWATLDEEGGYYHDVKWRWITETPWGQEL